MWILAHRRPDVFGHRARVDMTQLISLSDVTILFRSLAGAVRSHVRDPQQLGRIEQEFLKLVSNNPLRNSIRGRDGDCRTDGIAHG